MAPSALGLLEPGPFSSRVLLRSWPGSGSQGSVCVKAGGRHSSRMELILPRASWRLGLLPESLGPGRLSAPRLPARSGGATLRPSGDTAPQAACRRPGAWGALTVHQVLSVGGRATCAHVFGSPSACGSLGAYLCPRLPGHWRGCLGGPISAVQLEK